MQWKFSKVSVLLDQCKKEQKAWNKLTSNKLKKCYSRTSCNVSNDAKLLNVYEDLVEKVFLCLDTNKAPGTENILARYLMDSEKLLALSKNEMNSSIKPTSFPEKSKITQIKSTF